MPPAKSSSDLVVKHDHWDDGNRCKKTAYYSAQSGARKEGNNGK